MRAAIAFTGVFKRYRLGGRASLREALMSPFRRRASPHGAEAQTLWALRGLSFHVAPGEAVGIIGPNGAGKTTVLKLATAVTRPTSGTITVRGRSASLIELGAGFHPDLSGRENIYLNGSILGLRRAEIRARFDEIVAFAELERFLETPVKRYSSGMFARLGFSVAAHINPDVLIIDEVLAVGDLAFQTKCLKRMSDLKAQGMAIAFVTHNLGYAQRLCERGIFLHRGEARAEGTMSAVIEAYRNHIAHQPTAQMDARDEVVGDASESDGEREIAIRSVSFECDDCGAPATGGGRTGAPLSVRIGYRAARQMDGVNIEVWLYGLDGSEYASFATAWDGHGGLTLCGDGEVRLEIPSLALMPGTYFVQVAISDVDGLTKYDMHWNRHRLVVANGPTTFGLLYQPHSWQLPQGATDSG